MINQPPKAEKISYNYKAGNQTINDEYSWLRDKNWPNVTDGKILSYLKDENQYYENFFKPFSALKEEIFNELKGRIKLADSSVYTKRDDYYYYTRTTETNEYLIYCRKYSPDPEKLEQVPEEILLDLNALAKGGNYARISAFAISPDQNLLAYSVDFIGNERYTVRFYDLKNKKYLKDEIPDTIGNIVWHEKLNGILYTPVDDKWRHDRVKFHYLDQDSSKDKELFHEPDTLYMVTIAKASSWEYVFITIKGHDNNEVYYISMQDQGLTPHLIRQKTKGVTYEIDHNGEYFYIRHNIRDKNFQIDRIPVKSMTEKDWQEYIAPQPKQYLTGFDITKNYLILNYKENGVPVIKVQNLNNNQQKTIDFNSPSFVGTAYSTNFTEDDIRVDYSSLAQPQTTYKYDFAITRLDVLKIQEIPCGFNPKEYAIDYIFVDNKGIKVPITLFYKKILFKKDGSNPLFLYGYGAYGINAPRNFKISAVSLVDHGFVYAVAHTRGGSELGREWYEGAKFLNKKNTFSDFIAITEHLINEKYTGKGNVTIYGGSAGGMLVGTVINERPELFKAAIAHVPFVDVLNTMLDEDLPLTPGEFKEWGDPKDLKYFEYMQSYSPYDNIKAQNYPTLLVTAGLSDPRVGYWEAAKWVARLRDQKLDKNPLLFKTNMKFGHSGASGRFDYLKETAEDIVFTLTISGKSK